MRLHAYYRSSTSYRVRIALNLKGLDYEIVPVDLARSEQRSAAYRARNPFAGVPVLEADGRHYAQSLAILEWLEERYPHPPLLPADRERRFTARELAYAIATELHAPLNLPVLQYLKHELGHDQPSIDRWYRHWLEKTLVPVELRLAELAAGDFLFDAPGLFEAVLIPQLYNARRFAFDLAPLPRMCRIEAACLALPAFARAHPDNQPDSPADPANETRVAQVGPGRAAGGGLAGPGPVPARRRRRADAPGRARRLERVRAAPASARRPARGRCRRSPAV